MDKSPKRTLIKAAMVAVGVILAGASSDGIVVSDDPMVIILAVAFITLINLTLKPVLLLLALPLIIATLGFGLFILNALLFMLASALVPGLEVHGFWPALWGGFLVSLLGFLGDVIAGTHSLKAQIRMQQQAQRSSSGGQEPKKPLPKRDDPDVIDI